MSVSSIVFVNVQEKDKVEITEFSLSYLSAAFFLLDIRRYACAEEKVLILSKKRNLIFNIIYCDS